ncbi:ABC-F family ATP-binding cassette domain-containing protein [Amaricoccus tamworthensis]|uniref:ABC-F family ATP-binding cassette domain-containing protein n=1 Tax=Amaricoccus tamworthensis TaxID=57002 RepID=UPI003C7E473B
MSLINVKDLGVTLGTPLFSGLSFTLNRGDRMGLVATNGAGKSTLLRCLAGDLEPSAGEITTSRGLTLGHVEQHAPEHVRALPIYDAVLDALSADAAENESWRVDIVLDDLEVPADLRHRPLHDLSGGWQRVALLARVWVTEPDVLLLDEPTNHLDLGRIGFLQEWLRTAARSVPVLVASHDRAFLDAVTNRTLFLRQTGSVLFPLPFTPARAALSERDAAEARRFENDMKQAEQLRRQAAKLKNIGVNSGSDLLITKTKQLRERADRLEEAARPAHTERSAGSIRLANTASHAKALVTIDGVDVTTADGRRLFSTARLWINRGDRIVVMGSNGTGKSHLISMVHRSLSADVPGIRANPSIVVGHADQGMTHLDDAASPLEAITSRFDVGDKRARSLLVGAGFEIGVQDAKMSALSGGQKSRLAMLVLRLTSPGLYLLDEPTNHLDIDGQEALEAELDDPDATALFVSHDRSFVRGVANRFWWIFDGKLEEVDDPEDFFELSLAGG